MALLGCAGTIPQPLASAVSREPNFRELRRQPEAYRGTLLALGGVVTQVEPVGEAVYITVSEFPLNGFGRQRPVVQGPPGGFFVIQAEPAQLSPDLRPGREMTMVGEVLGAIRLLRSEEATDVPLLGLRYIRIWGPAWWPRVQIGVWGTISP